MDFEKRFRDDLTRLAGDPESAALDGCMRWHFFDPQHDVGSMLRACGAARAVQKRLAEKVGPLRLAGRPDPARRFRPVFQRILRTLDEAEVRDQEPTDAEALSGADAPGTAPSGDAAASTETSA